MEPLLPYPSTDSSTFYDSLSVGVEFNFSSARYLFFFLKWCSMYWPSLTATLLSSIAFLENFYSDFLK